MMQRRERGGEGRLPWGSPQVPDVPRCTPDQVLPGPSSPPPLGWLSSPLSAKAPRSQKKISPTPNWVCRLGTPSPSVTRNASPPLPSIGTKSAPVSFPPTQARVWCRSPEDARGQAQGLCIGGAGDMLLDHKNERETKRVWPVHYHCRGNPCGVRSRIWSALWSEQEAGGGGGLGVARHVGGGPALW